MTLSSRWKVLWLPIVGAGCLVLVLILWAGKRQPGNLDLHLAGRPQLTNGAMFVTLVLSNGTSRTLNIVDDGAGNPFVVLDAGPASNAPGSIGTGLGVLANTLKLNLPPGAALTHAVLLTNPPPRFRLLVEVRDLAAESRGAAVELLRFVAEKAKLWRPTRDEGGSILLPCSPWIENGTAATTTVEAADRRRQTPTD